MRGKKARALRRAVIANAPDEATNKQMNLVYRKVKQNYSTNNEQRDFINLAIKQRGYDDLQTNSKRIR